jgi:hypothetical protein
MFEELDLWIGELVAHVSTSPIVKTVKCDTGYACGLTNPPTDTCGSACGTGTNESFSCGPSQTCDSPCAQ